MRAMTERNVSAVYVGEVSEEEDDGSLATAISDGKYQLIFTSPESLLCNETWRDMLQSPIFQENLVALVIDKAHCVTKWYVTFRLFFCIL